MSSTPTTLSAGAPRARNTSKPKPRLLKDEALIAIERMIVNGELEPGAWVSETDLIQLTGHTRASVRNAIARLQEQELVAIYPRRGAQICPLDYTRHFRLLELRRVVEPLLAQSAAARASTPQRREFAQIAEGFEAVTRTLEQSDMTELDLRHYALTLDAADNPYAAKAMVAVKGLSRRFWVLHQEKHGSVVEMARAHGAVASAISEANEAGAQAAATAVVDYVERFTLAVVGYRQHAVNSDQDATDGD